MRNLHKALEVLIRPLQTPSPTLNSFIVAVSSVSADALKTLLEQEATIARLTEEIEEARLEFAARRSEDVGALEGWKWSSRECGWVRGLHEYGSQGRVWSDFDRAFDTASFYAECDGYEDGPVVVDGIRDGMRWCDAELRKAGLL